MRVRKFLGTYFSKRKLWWLISINFTYFFKFLYHDDVSSANLTVWSSFPRILLKSLTCGMKTIGPSNVTSILLSCTEINSINKRSKVLRNVMRNETNIQTQQLSGMIKCEVSEMFFSKQIWIVETINLAFLPNRSYRFDRNRSIKTSENRFRNFT